MTEPLEDQLETLDDDIRKLRREIDSSDRAGPRVTNETEWFRTLQRKRLRLARMELEREQLVAELQS